MGFRSNRRYLDYSKIEFMSKQNWGVVLAVLVAVSLPSLARAQGLETLGTRAATLGAFVAVADDASAVAWNPSGLVSGPFFNIALGLGRTREESDEALVPGARSGRMATTLIALGTTPAGLAYYRLSSTTLLGATPAVAGSSDRQVRQAIARTLVTNHLGATVQQSVGDYLTLGATFKLVRGRVTDAVVEANTWDEAFDRAREFGSRNSTRGDLDIGAMLAAGRVRAGLVIRNVTAPTFDARQDGGEQAGLTLQRHLRVGVAWADRWPGIARTVVAVDADVTRVAHPAGERRDVAAGLERWLRGQQVGLRAGLRASTVGEARPVVSAGGSVAVRGGMYLDAYVARGARMARGWGVAARVTY
jgi:hypothetical protein